MATTGFAVLGTHAVLDVLSVLVILQYHRRRNYQPIRSRFYWQGEYTAVSLIIASLSMACAIEFANDISCEVYLLIVLALFNAIIPVLIRIAHVFSAYEVSKVYAQDRSSGAEETALKNGNIFLRRAELLQSLKVQATAFFSIITLHVIVWVIYTQVFKTTCEGVDELIGICIMGSGYMVVTLYLGWNLATLKDGLYIRLEMVLVAVGGVIIILTFLALRFASGSYYHANLALAFGPFWIIAVQIGMPLYKSYAWQRRRSGNSSVDVSVAELSLTSLKSSEMFQKPASTSETARRREKPNSIAAFRRLLASEHGYELFLEFSRLELSHENVLFYHEVTPLLERARQHPEIVDTQDFVDRVLHVHEKFVASNARLELNLSSEQRAMFSAAGFDEPTASLDRGAALEALREAWKEIFTLMFRDVYARFRRSAHYESYLATDL